MSGYRWRVKRDGTVTNKPKDIDDHTLDCLAMLASEVATPNAVQIGGDLFA